MERSLSNRLQQWRHRTRDRLSTLIADAEAMDTVDSEFLPNFCRGWVVFNVVTMAELLAILVTLLVPRGIIAATAIGDFFLISLFVQWVAITGTAVLCYTRRYLNKLPRLRALGASYLILLCVTAIVTEAAVWLLWLTSQINTVRPIWYGDLMILNLTVSAIVNGLLLRYFLAKHELRQRTLSEARAKLQALQSRIRPHFVFNSLNIIASLTRSEPAKAEAAIEDMADLFRMMLSQDENLVPIKNEIDVARKYLDLEALRLDNRLFVDWDIGTFPRKCVMPVLTLQPLLENAIRHGIEAIPSGGRIQVRLWEEADQIHIRIENPMPQKKGKQREENRQQSLDNIRQRFTSYYGDTASLETRQDDDRFVVTVTLPTRGDGL